MVLVLGEYGLVALRVGCAASLQPLSSQVQCEGRRGFSFGVYGCVQATKGIVSDKWLYSSSFFYHGAIVQIQARGKGERE